MVLCCSNRKVRHLQKAILIMLADLGGAGKTWEAPCPTQAWDLDGCENKDSCLPTFLAPGFLTANARGQLPRVPASATAPA